MEPVRVAEGACEYCAEVLAGGQGEGGILADGEDCGERVGGGEGGEDGEDGEDGKKEETHLDGIAGMLWEFGIVQKGWDRVAETWIIEL